MNFNLCNIIIEYFNKMNKQKKILNIIKKYNKINNDYDNYNEYEYDNKIYLEQYNYINNNSLFIDDKNTKDNNYKDNKDDKNNKDNDNINNKDEKEDKNNRDNDKNNINNKDLIINKEKDIKYRMKLDNKPHKLLIDVIDEQKEIENEILLYKYHKYKNTGNWKFAKMIISNTNKLLIDIDNTFLWDYLDIQFKHNNDDFNNIIKVYYKNNLDIIKYEFNNDVAKYLIDNLQIPIYKYTSLFNDDINKNKWNFNIIIITKKNIYSANRYIDNNNIGFY